jgi:hypothetical protein
MITSPIPNSISRDYTAASAAACKKAFGTSWLGKNPLKFLFFNPIPLNGAMIAQVSLIRYYSLEFLAYPTLNVLPFQEGIGRTGESAVQGF